MPYKAPVLPLGVITPRSDPIQIVDPGNRITDLSILPEASGATAWSFLLRIGNNPWVRITRECLIEIDANALKQDSEEGVFFANETAQAPLTASFLVSYYKPTPGEEGRYGGVRVVPA